MPIDYFKKRTTVATYDQLQAAETKLAKKIMKDYKDKEPIIVGLMNGSIIFLGSMLLKLTMDVQVQPLKIYTYSKGDVNKKLDKKLDTDRIKQEFEWDRLRNRHVIVMDELLDSGDTLDFITKKIKRDCKPKSLKTCVLLAKRRKRPFNIKPDYVGMWIVNKWVTGYGMGFKCKYRNLRDVVILDEEDRELKGCVLWKK